MNESDDRLAPVTYLPGVARPSEPATASGRRIGNHPAGSGLPTLRSVLGDATDGAAADADRSRDDRAYDDPVDDDELDDEVPAHRIEAISMRALGRKGLSRRELERTLRQRGVGDAAVEAEVARLEGVGLLDDVALAQNLVGTLQERKGLARSGIAAELTRRLLSPAAIEYALELIDSGDELAKAKELAAGRARQLGGLDRQTAERRLSAWLARRGYGGSTVRSAVDHALGSPKAGATVRFR